MQLDIGALVDNFEWGVQGGECEDIYEELV
jgi:hypothetical protein